MRLINANKLKKDFLDLPNCYNGFSDTYDKSLIIDVVDEQPIVKAIPIEWIKKYLSILETISKDNIDLGEEGYYNEIITIESLLFAWEKENES